MTYFADLTPYTYAGKNKSVALNVGWLDIKFPFDTEVPDPKFVDCLRWLVNEPIDRFRGSHACQWCPVTSADGKLFASGNGTIIVLSESKVYAAPQLIHHYVSVHHYNPPQEFIDAVMAKGY